MSGERVCPGSIKTHEEYLIYLKGIFLYEWSRQHAVSTAVCLDIGCGEGYGASTFATGVKYLTAIDVDQRTIFSAAEKYAAPNLEFKVYDGYKLPFADNSFDVVTAFHVIEHVKDDLNFIDEAKRVLRSGGKLILATPNREMRLIGNMAPWNIHHFREYNDFDLKMILTCPFGTPEIFGLSACPQVIAIEKARIRQALKLVSLDRLELRRRLPRWFVAAGVKLLHTVKGVLKKPQPYKVEKSDQAIYFMEDYSGENSLDVVAVCVK